MSERESNQSLLSPRNRRNSLKQVLQQTIILQEVINDSTINKLDAVINKADDITNETSVQEKVKNQQEVLIDSEMMTLSSKILKTCTNSLTKRMCDYNYIDFAEKLVNYLENTSDNSQSLNWSLLEKQVTKLFKSVPNYNTLLGTLEPLEKKVIVRKKPQQRILSQAAMKVPDKILPQQVNTKDEDSVEKTVKKIKKLIVCYCKEMRKPLDLFQLILHPHDFGRTIRNLLYISFLVKDGVIKLKKDNRGSLVVEPCHVQTSSQERQSNNKTGNQSVISLNMDQWMILKRAYEVQEPMIDFDEDK